MRFCCHIDLTDFANTEGTAIPLGGTGQVPLD